MKLTKFTAILFGKEFKECGKKQEEYYYFFFLHLKPKNDNLSQLSEQ